MVTIPAVLFTQLQHQNQILKQENVELKQQAMGLNAQIVYLKKWESSQATIEGLQNENRILRKENQELRDEISTLKRRISDLSNTQLILMKSFERENKLAVRKMIDDAKKKGLQYFSIEVQNFINSKPVKKSINSAAHVFAPLRVKDAIDCEKSNYKKAILLSMWNTCYDVEDEDSDNSECEVDDLQ